MRTQPTTPVQFSRKKIKKQDPKTILDKIKEQIRYFLENAE